MLNHFDGYIVRHEKPAANSTPHLMMIIVHHSALTIYMFKVSKIVNRHVQRAHFACTISVNTVNKCRNGHDFSCDFTPDFTHYLFKYMIYTDYSIYNQDCCDEAIAKHA